MAQKTFEAAMARLEQLTEELESGDISLDKSLKNLTKASSWPNSATPS